MDPKTKHMYINFDSFVFEVIKEANYMVKLGLQVPRSLINLMHSFNGIYDIYCRLHVSLFFSLCVFVLLCLCLFVCVCCMCVYVSMLLHICVFFMFICVRMCLCINIRTFSIKTNIGTEKSLLKELN